MTKKKVAFVILILMLGIILVVSGTIQINVLNLVNWFKELGQGIWARLAPIIPVKELLCFFAGVVVTIIVTAIRKRKKHSHQSAS